MCSVIKFASCASTNYSPGVTFITLCDNTTLTGPVPLKIVFLFSLCVGQLVPGLGSQVEHLSSSLLPSHPGHMASVGHCSFESAVS